MTYKNPIPVAVALLEVRKEGLIAVQRINDPNEGWAFPGGYINEGESAAQAVSRELLEETGILIYPNFWSPVDTLITPDNKLLIFMECWTSVEMEQLQTFAPNAEVGALKLVIPGDKLIFPLHEQVLNAYIFE